MKTELDENDIKKAIQFWLWETAGFSVNQSEISLYKDSVMTEQIYADINKHTEPQPRPQKRGSRGGK